MSNMSIISDHYDAVAQLSAVLNESVLILKKEALRRGKVKSSTRWTTNRSDKVEARKILDGFADELFEVRHARVPLESTIPRSVVKKIERLGQTQPHFDQDLQELHNRLANNRYLTKRNFKLIETLLSIIDSDRSAVFRKLWRKR